jgi:transcriptional regulator with XRE-family HTH domain
MYLNRVKTQKLRKAKGLKGPQIAECLNYQSTDDYYARECGAVPISDVDLAILAKLLGVPAAELTATTK